MDVKILRERKKEREIERERERERQRERERREQEEAMKDGRSLLLQSGSRGQWITRVKR